MIRRLDLGPVTGLRSQAIYHGLAEAMDPTTPDTIVFCSPREPYFCVGYHQRAADVLDLAVCRRRGWPVLRRKIGGGAVYLDPAQLFYQVIVHRSRAPFAVDRIYATYLAAPVLALRRLGLPARLETPNEIEVRGRRIAGTGGGQLGEAVVVVGNVLLGFPDSRMARAWRAPSAPFRRLAREGLRRHLTTLGRELESVPAMAALADALADAYAETLGRPLVPGALSAGEVEAVRAAEAELASVAFGLDGGSRPGPGLKIARGVYVFEGREANAGIRVSLRVREDVIDDLAVRGADARVARRLVGRRIPPGAATVTENPADHVAALLAAEPNPQGGFAPLPVPPAREECAPAEPALEARDDAVSPGLSARADVGVGGMSEPGACRPVGGVGGSGGGARRRGRERGENPARGIPVGGVGGSGGRSPRRQ